MLVTLKFAGHANQRNMKLNNFQRIRELNYLQKAALSAALLERMLPNYQLFSEATEFGDGEQLRIALNLVWEKIAVAKAKISFEKLTEKVEENTPDLNDFDMFGVYPAIDAATALLGVLNGLATKDEQDFINVSKISQASVAKYIEYELTVKGEVADNQAIREHPLMQYEVAVLGELIDEVAKQERISGDGLKALKAKALADGQSNLGIEISE